MEQPLRAPSPADLADDNAAFHHDPALVARFE
jgi:hypothetical protein